MKKILEALAAAGGAVASFFINMPPLVWILIAVMSIDYVTGLICGAMGKSQKFSKRILDSFTLQQKAVSDKLVQRGLYTAIVDEADNVLIDEAVTPLIISREKENKGFNRNCEIAFELSGNLVRDVDYKVDIKLRTVRFLVDMDARLEEIQDELDKLTVYQNTRCLKQPEAQAGSRVQYKAISGHKKFFFRQ